MTTPSPLPPLPDDGVQLRVSPVMTGQPLVYQDGSGRQTVAPADLVFLAAHRDGKQLTAYQMTPAQAMSVARALATAAGHIINAEIDDDGRALSPLAKLHKLGTL